MQRSLPVFIDGTLVATLTEPRTNKFTLSYGHGGRGLPVSARLPWSADRYPPAAVAPWIDSLLPPEPIRNHVAAELGIPPHLRFRLLAACGADLPGAVVLGDHEPSLDHRPLVPDALLDEIPVAPHDGAWVRPAPGTPSSHIARFEDELLPGSVAAERFALTLARAAGIDTVDADQAEIHGTPTLIVARADRTVSNGAIGRRHLESLGSLCGVTLDGDDERIYQERGGPGFREVADALDAFAADPRKEIVRLVDHMVLHVCVGNTNAHANSYTLLLPDRTLGPIQTLLPAEIYTELVIDEGTFDIDHRLAMTIGGQTAPADVARAALIGEAAAWPRLGPAAAEERVDDVLRRIAAGCETAAAAVPDVPDRLPALVFDRLEQLIG